MTKSSNAELASIRLDLKKWQPKISLIPTISRQFKYRKNIAIARRLLAQFPITAQPITMCRTLSSCHCISSILAHYSPSIVATSYETSRVTSIPCYSDVPTIARHIIAHSLIFCACHTPSHHNACLNNVLYIHRTCVLPSAHQKPHASFKQGGKAHTYIINAKQRHILVHKKLYK